jgi:hypothetical protein
MLEMVLLSAYSHEDNKKTKGRTRISNLSIRIRATNTTIAVTVNKFLAIEDGRLKN